MRCLADLGALHFDWGKLGIAERDWREVMTTNHRTLGPEHRSTLYAKDFLALILGEQGRVGEGEALARESLDARRKRHGASHPEVAYSLRNIGLLKRLKGEPAEAETPLRDALAICRAAQCSVLGDVLTNLGAVLNELGNPHEAESLLQEALPILTEQAGPSHYATSVTRSALGYSFALQGRYAEAESLLLRAYHDQNTRKDYWGVKGRREILPLLVGLYRRQGKSAEAAKYERLLGIARANSQ
jgi:tetratricopeptide (TPR) repeat protein